jgi:hypothetical protein
MNLDSFEKPLLGCWSLVRDESQDDTGQGVTIEFTGEGTLTYSTDVGQTIQIIKLAYRIDGDELVTNQPSLAREHRTKFYFDENSLLILENEGKRSWYKRA